MDAAVPTEPVTIYGHVPVQSEGELTDGKKFYFRSRYDGWSFAIGDDPVCPGPEGRAGTLGYYRDGPYGEEGGFQAGWMPHEMAREIVERCLAEYASGRRFVQFESLEPWPDFPPQPDPPDPETRNAVMDIFKRGEERRADSIGGRTMVVPLETRR